MTISWVEYRATVPDWSVPALNQRVAELSAQAAALEDTLEETVEQRVRRAWDLIKTPDGRTLTRILALGSLGAPNGWVEWATLCSLMGMRARKLSGVLGGIIKSTKDVQPLFERDRIGDRNRLRMSREVAQAVVAVAREETLVSKPGAPIGVIYSDYRQMIKPTSPRPVRIADELKSRYGIGRDDWIHIKVIYEYALAGDELAARLVARVDNPNDDLTLEEAYRAVREQRDSAQSPHEETS